MFGYEIDQGILMPLLIVLVIAFVLLVRSQFWDARRRDARDNLLAPFARAEQKLYPNLDELIVVIHSKVARGLKPSRINWSDRETTRQNLRRVVEHVCDVECPLMNLIERETLITAVLDRFPALKTPA